jgi:D-alanyl-D-alanine carboxypeptidase
MRITPRAKRFCFFWGRTPPIAPAGKTGQNLGIGRASLRYFSVISLAIALLCALLTQHPAEAAKSNPKYAAIVVDANTGRVLYSRNADSYRYPASLTKMMTLYMLFEALERGDFTMASQLKVTARAAGQPPSKLGLKSGQNIRVRDAILALVVRSANDVAVVVAEALGGTESKFAAMMTKRARELGMTRTTFRNASGLPNNRQKTTARDMYALSLRIQEDFPQFYGYFATAQFVWGPRTYKTHNNLLGKYKGTDGIKTGYIRASGFNLASSVHQNGRHLIGVVMGGKTARRRDAHMKDILTKSFARLKNATQNRTALAAPPPIPRLRPTKVQMAGVAPRLKPEMAPYAGVLMAPPSHPDADTGGPQTKAVAVAPEQDATSGNRKKKEKPKAGVIIGAYKTKKQASVRLKQAERAASITLRDSNSVVMSIEKDGEKFYRGRFSKLTDQQADRACATLQRKGFLCFVALDPENQQRAARD